MKFSLSALLILIVLELSIAQSGVIVFQTDFGLKDGAVAAMKGVALNVSPALKMFDLTHEIPPFNIWEAAYRLNQTASYWPKGTVFVSVVDPGVGSERRSVVMKSESGHFFVTPDNGTLTLVAESLGVTEVRIIDERTNRLQHSNQSYTFHGRDVYAYTAARLASKTITFEQVGEISNAPLVLLPYTNATAEKGVVHGNIDILDIQYGNVWTNIQQKHISNLKIKPGEIVHVRIAYEGIVKFDGDVPFVNTFSEAGKLKPLAYFNSLMNFSLALNEGNFSETFQVYSGPGWKIDVSLPEK